MTLPSDAVFPGSQSPGDLRELEQRLRCRFRNTELLQLALRHASYVNEQADTSLEDNERLEFLGDAVLDLAVGHLLMEAFPEADEGTLSKFRATLVDEACLCRVALGLHLGEYLLLGKGEEQCRGREKPSILAGAAEALLGALYLDAGFDRTMEIIRELFSPFLERTGTEVMTQDYKSLLQEFTQHEFKCLPSYRLMEESGMPHDRLFRVTVHISGKTLAEGVGKSKKEAEQKAAQAALACLDKR